MKTILTRLSAIFLPALAATATQPPAGLANSNMVRDSPSRDSLDTTLCYQQPATSDWMTALPLGNGRIGGMVFGGVRKERIMLNESSVWSGWPEPANDRPGAERKAVFQTGLEDRSLTRYHLLAELVRNGAIGKLHTIKVGLPTGMVFPKEESVSPPADLDYNLWLGPAPWQPYCKTRVDTSGWRMIRDYSGGTLTDWGMHLVDTAQVANFAERTSPVEVAGTATIPPDSLTDVPVNFDLRYRFANGVGMEVNGNGVFLRFEGDKGWIGNRGWEGPFESSDMALLRLKFPRETNKLWPRPPREHRNFLDYVRSRAATTYSAEDLHRLSTTLHIGNIAMQLGRKLRWDPETETFPDDPQADQLKSRVTRDWQSA